MNPDDNYPADLGMVPSGTKCGNEMVRKRAAVDFGFNRMSKVSVSVSPTPPLAATVFIRCATIKSARTFKTFLEQKIVRPNATTVG